ncbi:DCC1-like thiol-disulfide oxidoreductase family protein [Leeuwenhoekiella sp. MAR_2009_132]|uniref:thiol-disulfide oxidoreductase DCC family protein n=1 Tax=Flavimarina sp. Hel_I_48 TaxID=1392488 RepID=UPI0004DFB0A7
MKTENPDKKIVLFDGVCNLCNSAITFIIKRDTKDMFRFAPLTSDLGIKLLNKFDIDPEKTDSLILITEEKAFIKSSAALHIARDLSGGWPVLSIFLLLPKFIRNGVYDFIAKNRYNWFGKKESCMIPTPTLKDKFLT